MFIYLFIIILFFFGGGGGELEIKETEDACHKLTASIRVHQAGHDGSTDDEWWVQ